MKRSAIKIILKNCNVFFASDRLQFDLASIPKIFLVPALDLSQKDNFDAVFPFAKDSLLTEECNIVMHVKQMQEKVRTTKRKKQTNFNLTRNMIFLDPKFLVTL